MNISERIKLLLKILELEKQQSATCKDCENCRVAKGIKDRIITMSAEVIAEQSRIINSEQLKMPVATERPKPPGGLN